MQTILHGKFFFISDNRGDVRSGLEGLYARDTRHISHWVLRVDGRRPQPLGPPQGPHFQRSFVQRNIKGDVLDGDSLIVERRYVVDDALYQRFIIENLTMDELSFAVTIEAGADFSDIFQVKRDEFTKLGNDTGEVGMAGARPHTEQTFAGEQRRRRAGDDAGPELVATCASENGVGGGGQRATIASTREFEVDGQGRLAWQVTMAPRARFMCDVRVSWQAAVDERPIEFDLHRHRIDQEIAMWLAETPQLVGGRSRLRHAYRVSVQDLAALRIHNEQVGPAAGIEPAGAKHKQRGGVKQAGAAGKQAAATTRRRAVRPGAAELLAAATNGSEANADHRASDPGGMLPAAGLPWFMTVFGRDTLITCLQTIALGPVRAMTAIENLARLQAQGDDPAVDAEPGKILHELREGAIAARGYDVYYGSVDSTPLFLVLLDEIHRWTRDDGFVRRHEANARAALEWIERHGDLDDDGYLEYRRRSPQGLVNQSWKDSWNSQRFHDGRTAEGDIAPVEVQGYAYDARLRMARLAREVWKDRPLATRLERDAEELRQRFNRDFWVQPERVTPVGPDDPRRDGFFALALDGDKRPVDSLTSNVGHLLWSGIVAPDKIDAVVRQLTSRHMYNGYGIRTMSTLDAAFNPISYHNGTVWPHDTSICVAGLVRAGAYDVAGRIANALFDAAVDFHGRLPEVFAGLDRSETGHPVTYPTTCSPQAWAAAAPVLLLTELIGLAPHPKRKALTLRHTSVPHWLDDIEWRGIHAFGRQWDVSVRHGIPRIERR